MNALKDFSSGDAEMLTYEERQHAQLSSVSEVVILSNGAFQAVSLDQLQGI